MRIETAGKRLAAALALLLALAWSGSALALGIMDPFNVGPAMDSGAKQVANGVPYGAGPRKVLDVYAPDHINGAAPVLFFIYGGGWDHGDRGDYQFVGRAFASRGFVVVIPDYRLYPDVKYPDFLDDNAQAMRWVQDNIAKYGGDTERVFMAGHSAGAYDAVMLALDDSYFHDAGVNLSIRGVAALSGPYDFYPFEYAEVQNSFGSAPNPQGTQPVNLVAPDDPPMFLASGTHDPIVRIQNTQNLARLLRAQGNWVTEKSYDGLGHMDVVFALGAMWRWRASVFDDMMAFFQRFGAFPSGVPIIAATPAPSPADAAKLEGVVTQIDSLMQPIGGHGSATADAPAAKLAPPAAPPAAPKPSPKP
jgi:acetyl esterase/lipase